MNVITIVVSAFLILMMLIGKKRGLVKTLFSMFSMFIALILTMVLYPMINDLLANNEKLVDRIETSIESVLPIDDIIKKEVDKKKSEVIDDLPLSAALKDKLNENNNDEVYKALGVESLEDYIVKYITQLVIRAIAFISTYIVCQLLIRIIGMALGLFTSLPVIKQANSLLGMLAGLATGVLIVWVAMAVVSAFSYKPGCKYVMNQISESPVLEYIYERDIFLKSTEKVE
ncbi:MAG TPA: hypothetical protein DEO62_06130 [Lachnospiraceae bacterium]|nr:hypothetical protein [Lachnospiraceae bacterium]